MARGVVYRALMAGDGREVLGLRACPTCGLVHRVGVLTPQEVARCVRCRAVVAHGSSWRGASRTAALCVAALVLLPLALSMPVMTLERFGHASVASIWTGTIGLLAEGHLGVGLTVLLFSVIAPPAKLAALLVLSSGRWLRGRGRAVAYHAVEFLGRWGMLDVLLVAVLVAAVKLGDLVQVTPGPGIVVFGAVVVLSLLASMSFDPHAAWGAGR
jgi:paraquat-inducible protein A